MLSLLCKMEVDILSAICDFTKVISEPLLSCDLQFETHYVRSSLPKSSSQAWILFLLHFFFLLLFLCILNVVIFYTQASRYIHIHLLLKKKRQRPILYCALFLGIFPRVGSLVTLPIAAHIHKPHSFELQ